MENAIRNSQIFKTASSMLIAAAVCSSYLQPELAIAAAQKPQDKATQAETTKRSEQKTTDKRKEIVSEAVSTIREC
jgi:hypothetical protein